MGVFLKRFTWYTCVVRPQKQNTRLGGGGAEPFFTTFFMHFPFHVAGDVA